MGKYEIGLELVTSKWAHANDVEREQILLELKRSGLPIIDAIRALQVSGFFSLGEAKKYVSASPAWHVEAENGKIFHEIAWQVLDDFAASQAR